MFGDIIQPTHLLFILVVALLVLGPKRLPEVGRSLGKGLSSFRQGMQGVQDEARGMFGDAHEEPAHRSPSSAPSVLPQTSVQPNLPETVVTAGVAPAAVQSGVPEPVVSEPAVARTVSEPVVGQAAVARTVSEPDPADYAD